MKKISVVILNWNGEAMLRQFLPSVIAYSEAEGVEVCVADNASSDASCDVVRKEFPAVRLIELEENYGFAEGYNRALQQVDAEYVVLLNSDIEVTPHWLEPLRDFMEVHPEVAACQPKLLSQRNKEFFEYAGAAGGMPVFWVSGAAFFVRLKDYREAGGLDGRFFAHMEEIDLCWRFRSRGRGLVCIPQSVVYHVGAATLKKESPRKTYLNFRNNLLMLYKNLPEKELNKVLCVRGFLDRIAAMVFYLKKDKESAKAVFQARRDFERTRYSFASARVENMMKATDEPIPERVEYSILWKYHALGKKRFSQLRNFVKGLTA